MNRTYPWVSSCLWDSLERTPALFTPITLFALIGLILSPLAVVAHAPVSPTDSVHSYAPFDYEQWRRDHPRPAGKALAALNRGEPRTVRMIYFLPNDRPYQAEVVQKMKEEMLRIQTFYAEQMQAQGQGNRTFLIETDAQGQPRVHRVDGRYPNSHYLQHDTADDVLEEIDPIFDIEANVYLIVVGTRDLILSNGREVGGVGSRSEKMGGFALTDGDVRFDKAAHELGHVFGLDHDFRDDTYIMSYGSPDSDRARLSDCNAEFLAVHPYFNRNSSTSTVHSAQPTSQLISPHLYSPGSASVPIRLKVGGSKGLHQAILTGRTREPHFAAGFQEVQGCRGFAGQQEAVAQFEYDGTVPSSPLSRLSDFVSHSLRINVVDADGNSAERDFILAERTHRVVQVALLQHEHQVHSLSFSPDGTLLAVGSGTRSSLWKWRTDKVSSPFRGQNGPMLFSPNGRLLAIGGWTTVELWDVTGTQLVDTFEYDAQTKYSESMSFSSDGDLLAIGTKENVELWDVAAKRRVAAIDVDKSWVRGVSFSHDGSLLAFENGDEVVLWDVATKRRVDALKHRDQGWVEAVSFSPDGTLLGVSRGENVDLWNVARRRQIASFEHQGWVEAVSFSPDGNLVAAGGFAGASVWDVSSRRRAAIFYGEDGNSLSFSPDGTLLAVGSREEATVRLWDVSEWTQSSGQVIATGDEEETTDDEEETTGDEEETTDDEEETTDDEEAIPQTLTKVSGNGQGGQAGEPLAKPFVVSVLDQNGAAFAGTVVTFSVTAGGGTLSASTATTDANGRARTTLTLGNDAGTNTVAATVAGLDPVTFTATAITPHSLTKVSGDRQQGQAGEQLAKPFVVLVLDEDGAAIAGAVITFTVTAGGGTMSSTTAMTNSSGRAARTLTLGSQPGTNTVDVSVAGLDPVTFIATAVGEESSFDLFDLFNQSGKRAAQPDRTQLLQNAPNPFNSQTVVSYFLLEPGPVRLEVFALSGQRIAVLDHGLQQAGYHRLHWDGRDAAGRSVASGIYLYRLMTSEDVLTRKLVLLR